MKVLREGFKNIYNCECPYCGSLLEYNRNKDVRISTQREYKLSNFTGHIGTIMVSYEEIDCPICNHSIRIRKV